MDGDRIVKFVYLAIFCGLTISPDNTSIKKSSTVQIAQAILTGRSSLNDNTSLYCSRRQNA